MVVKVYVSGISGNKEVKKRQQRVLMILESKNVEYEVIDITEPDKEKQKEFMQSKSNAKDSKHPLPPQIFYDEEYCGDYEDFDLANEIDELEKFLKVTPAVSTAEIILEKSPPKEIKQNGNTSSREPSTDKEAAAAQPESTPERRNSATEEKRSEEPEPTEHDASETTPEVAESVEAVETVEAAKPKENEPKEMPQADVEPAVEDSADKNEEKSDDQEKEE